MTPVRLTPAQAAQLQRQRLASDKPPEPAKPGRAPRHPVLADKPREPTRLLSFTITPPSTAHEFGGQFWHIKAVYNDGSWSMAVESAAEAQRIKTEMEGKYHVDHPRIDKT